MRVRTMFDQDPVTALSMPGDREPREPKSKTWRFGNIPTELIRVTGYPPADCLCTWKPVLGNGKTTNTWQLYFYHHGCPALRRHDHA